MPDRVDERVGIANRAGRLRTDAHPAPAEESLFQDLSRQRACDTLEAHPSPRLQFLSRMHQRVVHARTVGVTRDGGAKEEAFHGPAARHSMAEQPGREDPGVVDYQQIARPQQRWKIANMEMAHLSASTIRREEARFTTRQRLLGDQLVREVEVEVGDEHFLRF